MRVLIPIQPDAPARTLAAVEAAIRLHDREGAQLHLLSVQPRVSSHVAMCFGPGELRHIHDEAGRQEMASARAVLDAARVPYTCRLAVGNRAQSIAEVARELACDRILLGPAEAHPRLADRMFGSLGQQLKHLLAGTDDCKVIGS